MLKTYSLKSNQKTINLEIMYYWQSENITYTANFFSKFYLKSTPLKVLCLSLLQWFRLGVRNTSFQHENILNLMNFWMHLETLRNTISITFCSLQYNIYGHRAILQSSAMRSSRKNLHLTYTDFPQLMMGYVSINPL